MSNNFAKRLVLAASLVVAATAAATAAAGAQASVLGARNPYADGARAAQDSRDVFSEGARAVQDQRSPYVDGARNVNAYGDGARTVAGMDRTGVSAEPARAADPYLDGAYA
ncbi:hydroxyquinol 1,2-dioxygenase [Cupriavidus malaysiensis]|uniref:Hydroxyquinol 1,2-dioxygenase n=1 Tax=Cupriavidus malaysiensis TaxID=367825 RepID=A0ABN4TSR1_9BURK|nr:hydroxyquinol 1,2-dioxygenase [Cupriavidus malaysiensis]AOZ10312.1 hydroxyquinol 1,2-dioxygenase [Cupriavidus malaysiensis]